MKQQNGRVTQFISLDSIIDTPPNRDKANTNKNSVTLRDQAPVKHGGFLGDNDNWSHSDLSQSDDDDIHSETTHICCDHKRSNHSPETHNNEINNQVHTYKQPLSNLKKMPRCAPPTFKQKQHDVYSNVNTPPPPLPITLQQKQNKPPQFQYDFNLINMNEEIKSLENEVNIIAKSVPKLQVNATLPYLSRSAEVSPSSSNGNYTDRFKPKKITYKPCTLKEYRQTHPKLYVEIPKLKPDLNTDELLAKRANLQRIKEFSKNLHTYNKSNQDPAKRSLPGDAAKELAIAKRYQESKVMKAIEFANKVPKPVVKRCNFPQDSSMVQNCGIHDKVATRSRGDEVKILGSTVALSTQQQQQLHLYHSNRLNKTVTKSTSSIRPPNVANNGNCHGQYGEVDATHDLSPHKPGRLEELELRHRETKKQVEAIQQSFLAGRKSNGVA